MTTATECACKPGTVCEPCKARGYVNGLAGYAARIYPRQVTDADIRADAGLPPEQCCGCGTSEGITWRDDRGSALCELCRIEEMLA